MEYIMTVRNKNTGEMRTARVTAENEDGARDETNAYFEQVVSIRAVVIRPVVRRHAEIFSRYDSGYTNSPGYKVCNCEDYPCCGH